MPLSLGRGWGVSPSLSGQRSLSANYCRIPCWAAPTVPPTKALANRNSMCGKRGVNLPAPGKHMVHFLLTIRSLRRLGIIVQSNKRWHLGKEAFGWDARTRQLWAFSLVCGWEGFVPLRKQITAGDRGLSVQGQHVLLHAMSAANATKKQAFRQDHPSQH